MPADPADRSYQHGFVEELPEPHHAGPLQPGLATRRSGISDSGMRASGWLGVQQREGLARLDVLGRGRECRAKWIVVVVVLDPAAVVIEAFDVEESRAAGAAAGWVVGPWVQVWAAGVKIGGAWRAKPGL